MSITRIGIRERRGFERGGEADTGGVVGRREVARLTGYMITTV